MLQTVRASYISALFKDKDGNCLNTRMSPMKLGYYVLGQLIEKDKETVPIIVGNELQEPIKRIGQICLSRKMIPIYNLEGESVPYEPEEYAILIDGRYKENITACVSGTPDYFNISGETGLRSIIEVKTISRRATYFDLPRSVPFHWILQIQTYLYLFGLEYADLFCFYDNSIRIIRIQRDDAMIKEILDNVNRFFEILLSEGIEGLREYDGDYQLLYKYMDNPIDMSINVDDLEDEDLASELNLTFDLALDYNLMCNSQQSQRDRYYNKVKSLLINLRDMLGYLPKRIRCHRGYILNSSKTMYIKPYKEKEDVFLRT